MFDYYGFSVIFSDNYDALTYVKVTNLPRIMNEHGRFIYQIIPTCNIRVINEVIYSNETGAL